MKPFKVRGSSIEVPGIPPPRGAPRRCELRQLALRLFSSLNIKCSFPPSTLDSRLSSFTSAVLLGIAFTAAAQTTKQESAPIPADQIGAVAGKQYQGDGLAVTATREGALLRCVFQRMEGQVTREGLWLTSTAEGAKGEKFRVVARAVGRDAEHRSASADSFSGRAGSPLPAADGAHGVTRPTLLPANGTVQVTDNLARFIRPGLIEEYSVSVDGIRQDFIIQQRPTLAPNGGE